jgi:molybdopterin/thiamine biosynthesis adenylyltransferase
VDVAYEEASEPKTIEQIDINDAAVKDRWSRYIGAMGIEAVAKQAESTIFLSGVGGLGVEIAKNLILAGCKELILHDRSSPSYYDLSSQFFLNEQSVTSQQGISRAELCKAKL